MTNLNPAIGAIAGIALMFVANDAAYSQGCVAVRPMGCATSEYASPANALLQKGEWQFSSTYQHFKSFRHFRGDHEEADRVKEDTEVINVTHSNDFGLSYGPSDRMDLTLNIPLTYYDRSSLYEHYGNSEEQNPTHARFETGSKGLGDIRVSGNYWLFDPNAEHRGNIALGLGIKVPTGDSNVQDTFHKLASDGSDSTFTKAVDQSIQLGDGGWGFTVQGQGNRAVFSKAAVYFNGFYLFNPKEINDAGHSVCDQFAARTGLNYSVLPKAGLSMSFGGRFEGIPRRDLIGGEEGRRRPGYIVSVEPGLSYTRNAVNFALNVPVAVYRNRIQSVSDKQRTAQTGVFTQGDAAFADYLINFSISAQFGKRHETMITKEEE